MMKNINLYIVPDVHGREFWKVLKDVQTDKYIVFLGDYLDPYPQENITKKQAIENFKEILEFAGQNQNVHLLLGNHDLEYSVGKWICNCRCDDKNYLEIRKIFTNNWNLFSITYEPIISDKKYLLSHAGVHPKWMKDWSYTANDIKDFNNLYLKRDGRFLNALAEVSGYRGGLAQATGSPVWADIREYRWTKKEDMDEIADVQICGHTQLMRAATLDNGISCIDTHHVYAIDEDDNLKIFEGQL